MNNVYRSATLKLTAWYMLLVMIVSITFSGSVYHFDTSELADSLNSQTQRIYRTFPLFYGNPFFRHNADLTNGSRRILLRLVEFNILLLITSSFASYWLARRTLEPIAVVNEQQKRFVADASHELRTPLAALKMSTEVALMDKAASNQSLRDTLASNLEETNKLDILLNTLLRLSQLETNDIRATFAPLSLQKLVKEATSQVGKQAKAKHIIVVNQVTDFSVLGEDGSLVQLFVILLNNAIKYSPKKSTITISSERNNIIITDQGIGIPPDALQHVFDRFYRADKARSREEANAGFGLGLAIAKHIADLHNGTITLTSRVEHGTKATVFLPTHSSHEPKTS